MGIDDNSDHDHGHRHGHGDFRNKVWSMSSGPYCRRKNWKCNTAIAMVENSGHFRVHAPSEVASDLALDYLEHHAFKYVPKSVAYGYTASGYDLFKTCLMLTFMNLPKLSWLEKFDDSKVDIQVFGRGLLNHFL